MAQIVQQSQKTLWESFQRLLGVQQPPVAPLGQTPQDQGNVNPFAPEFLENLKKFGEFQNQVQPLPYELPQQNAYGQGFQNNTGRVSPDSYVASLQNFIRQHQR